MEIGKIELKKILKEQREEFQIFIGTLAEDFTAQVKLLAESVSDLQRQLIDEFAALEKRVLVLERNR